ncbi:hypothetical protein QX233_12765 [Chryseobacterium gambrini]|uniref:Cyanophycinase n=1 Tax=Chryseobacterium gambrini TaxID=373672 RepID=A0AAJ1VJQ4_9FLAO|nr:MULTISPECIES: hypothetical protein [Chryseobacterium]MDN4013340.1 hypothetical protein [Chryseobacterium gambrini]MDN4031291.1 hypothetical protein [Chryseobacterium gambrini]QWA39523.1 hypothetical protein KKI44_04755 [Chryseobacterium sp. ZHDP1]
MNKGTFAHPKGRLIIAGGKVQKEVHDTEEFFPIREVLKLLYGQKDEEIAVIIFSQDSEPKEKISALLSDHGFADVLFIDPENYQHEHLLKLSSAKAVFLTGNKTELCENFKKSSLSEIVYQKYCTEEDFTVASTDDIAMFIPKITVSPSFEEEGLNYISNCIIDNQFAHGLRFRNLVKAVIQHPECLGFGIGMEMILIIEKGYRISCIGNGSVMVVNAKYIKKRRLKKGASVYMKNLKGHILIPGSVLNLHNGKIMNEQIFDYNLNFTNRNIII